MPYNVLVVASTSLPSRADQRTRLGVPPRRTDGDVRTVRLEAVPAQAARALHALMRSTGGWAQVTPDGRAGRGVLLQGDGAQFHSLLRRAGTRHVTFEAAEIREVLMSASTRPRALALARGRLALGQRTLVMGVLNVTPDSFSDGGRFLDPRAAVERAHAMAREGADLIDIGGESTRPGAVPVPLSEEVRPAMPVV